MVVEGWGELETRRDEEAMEENRPPRYRDYPDTGCQEAPSCLRCPLPRCRYDQEAEAERRQEAAARDRRIRSLRRREGLGVGELARRFGLTTRTIRRILRGEE